jgi:hypothetical protein
MTGIVQALPEWAQSVGSLARANALVRASCRTCGVELRINPAMLEAFHGSTFSLAGHLDRCSMVGCAGVVSYRVSWSYGRAWLDLAP